MSIDPTDEIDPHHCGPDGPNGPPCVQARRHGPKQDSEVQSVLPDDPAQPSRHGRVQGPPAHDRRRTVNRQNPLHKAGSRYGPEKR